MQSAPVPTNLKGTDAAPAGSLVTGCMPAGSKAADLIATSLAPVKSGAACALAANTAREISMPITPAQAAPGRLTRRAEFLRVAAKGRKAPMPGLVLQALKRDDDAPARLGFTVTKKVGNAVIRNRTRRRLREAARLVLREQPVAGADLVLIGRDATRSRDFAALRDDLRRALGKVGVL
jgi:ribonuclease P protein component